MELLYVKERNTTNVLRYITSLRQIYPIFSMEIFLKKKLGSKIIYDIIHASII